MMYCVINSISHSFVQVISALAYLVHFIDGYQQYWLRTAWGFDNEVTFYYICGKQLNHLRILLLLVPVLHDCLTMNSYVMPLSVCGVEFNPCPHKSLFILSTQVHGSCVLQSEICN